MELTLNDGTIALVDKAAFEAVHEVVFPCGKVWRGIPAERKWQRDQRQNTSYVVCNLLHNWELRLHRVLLDASPGELVDHRDGNGLNNLLSNLRRATPQQNNANRGLTRGRQYKGVSPSITPGKWVAHIRVDGIKRHLGTFNSIDKAVAAYDKAHRRVHGEFALTNAAIHSGARPSPTGARA